MPNFSKQEQYLLVILIIAIFSGGGILVYKNSGGEIVTVIDNTDRVQADELEIPSTPSLKDETPKIYVHVGGEVKAPGVYSLEEGARVYEAIEMASGFTEEADMERLNLAQVLRDAQKIYIPSKKVDVELVEIFDSLEGSQKGVDINNASLAELATLPGIGQVLAKRILEYRRLHGPFETIEDLMKVAGIGEKKFEGIRELIRVY